MSAVRPLRPPTPTPVVPGEGALGAARRRRLADARLYVIGPAHLRAGRLADLLPALAGAGVDVVQLRDRTLDPDALRGEAEACAAAAARCGVLFLVNDSVELARAVGADGVHLGQGDGAVAEARAALGPDRLVGRTTRGDERLERAADEGADYASVSPIWATPTKPGRAPVGLSAVRRAAQAARLPWFALGGLDERRTSRVVALGARRTAYVRAVCDAADPVAAAAALRARLDGRPRVLTIAGTDSGGGAGITADVKAIARAGCFPLCAVTAVTAQTTTGVSGIEALSPAFVREQVDGVVADLGLDGIKTGMLGSAATIEAVAASIAALDPLDEIPVVVDPVMRAESGAPLLAPEAEQAMRGLLLPLASVATPNLFEAQALAGDDRDDAAWLAQTLHDRHGCAVIVTGGHGATSADVLCDDGGLLELPGVRLPRRTTHGAGCTHSSTLAAELAAGRPLRVAAAEAKRVATAAVRGGLALGAGAGPVDVFAAGAPRLG